MTITELAHLEQQTEQDVEKAHHHIWSLGRIREMTSITNFRLEDNTRCGSEFLDYAKEGLEDIKTAIKKQIYKHITTSVAAATESYNLYKAVCEEYGIEPTVSDPMAKSEEAKRLYGVELVDSGFETAGYAAKVLREQGLLNSDTTPKTPEFFVSDTPEGFENVAGLFLGRDMEHTVTQIDIEQY